MSTNTNNNKTQVTVTWDVESVRSVLGPDTDHVMVSMLTRTEETISVPTLVTTAGVVLHVTQCGVVTLRLAHLIPG